MARGGVERAERLASLIQSLIGSFIVEGKIKDPRVSHALSVSHVTVSRDLSFADVFISSYESGKVLTSGIAGLQSAAGFIQAKLAGALQTRQTPKLRFHRDDGVKEAFFLNQKIDELTRGIHENADDEKPAV